jgi:thiol-disulfide isomerase/thioredoxin
LIRNKKEVNPVSKKPFKILTTALILLLFVTGLYQSGFINSQRVLATTKAEAGKVIEASQNYLEPGKNKRMMMMDLGATTCIPCKMMVPIMDELAKELQGKIDIQFVDVYKRSDLAQKYKIFAIPTQIFFDKNGKELFRHEGFYPKTDIMAKLKELGLK